LVKQLNLQKVKNTTTALTYVRNFTGSADFSPS
jgi:hypothetical protein